MATDSRIRYCLTLIICVRRNKKALLLLFRALLETHKITINTGMGFCSYLQVGSCILPYSTDNYTVVEKGITLSPTACAIPITTSGHVDLSLGVE